MPIGAIAFAVAGLLVLHFMFVASASPRAKAAVGGLFGASLVFTQVHPEWFVIGLVLQCVIAIGLLMRLTVTR